MLATPARIAQAKAQSDQAIAPHQAKIEQQKAESDAIHQRVKLELAKIKAKFDAKMALLDAT